MGTKNNPGAFDCYANAHPDEPMFVLLGRDKRAPTVVWLWATLRELDGEDAAKVAEARQCVTSMMRWAQDHDRKVVGLGQAALGAVMELIRAVNGLVKTLPEGSLSKASDDDVMRMFMAQTQFEDAD
jgi:hypothetical protein